MSTTLPMSPINALQRRLLTARQPIRRGDWRRWRRVLAAFYIPLITLGVYYYFDILPASLLLGGWALLYTPAPETQPNTSFRFGWAALLFSAFFVVTPAKTIACIALSCAVCLYRESFFRRLPATTPFILALLTPAASHLADTLTYPIRMGTANIAGTGLHLLIFSLLSALLLMNYFQRKGSNRISITVITILLLLTTLLNILANFLRSVSLMLLLILPGDPLYGIFGLLLPGLYVLLPLLPMIRFVIRRYGHPVLPANGPTAFRSRWVLAGNLLVAASIMLLVAAVLLRKEFLPANSMRPKSTTTENPVSYDRSRFMPPLPPRLIYGDT